MRILAYLTEEDKSQVIGLAMMLMQRGIPASLAIQHAIVENQAKTRLEACTILDRLADKLQSGLEESLDGYLQLEAAMTREDWEKQYSQPIIEVFGQQELDSRVETN